MLGPSLSCHRNEAEQALLNNMLIERTVHVESSPADRVAALETYRKVLKDFTDYLMGVPSR